MLFPMCFLGGEVEDAQKRNKIFRCNTEEREVSLGGWMDDVVTLKQRGRRDKSGNRPRSSPYPGHRFQERRVSAQTGER